MHLPRLDDHTASFELDWDLSGTLSDYVGEVGHPSGDVEIVLSNKLAVVSENFYISKWAHPYHLCVLIYDEGYLYCFERAARGGRGSVWRELRSPFEELCCELYASTNFIAHFKAVVSYRLYVVKSRSRANVVLLLGQVCYWGQDPAWIVDIDNELFSIENIGVVCVVDHKTQVVDSYLFHLICLDPQFS